MLRTLCSQIIFSLVKSKYGFNTTKERSDLMSKIKGKNTKPEILLRKALWKEDIRYRVNNPRVIGKPDISIKKFKIAIFVDGEFWHGYNWKEKKKRIKSNRDYWIKKIEGNMKRDKKYNQKLLEEGWTVLRFWEKEVKTDLESCVNKVKSIINASTM